MYDITGEKFFDAINLTIPTNVQAGDYVGPWYGRYIHNEGWRSGGSPFTFSACTDTGQVHSEGTSSKLVPVGARPPGVNPTPLAVTTTDGYSVYTTPTLESAGLGFAVRWKASNRWGDEGEWISPSGMWTGEVFEQSEGLPLWRWTVTNHENAYKVQGWGDPTNVFSSLADWNLIMEEYPPPGNVSAVPSAYFGIHYDAWVEVRYVAIGPSQHKYVPNDHTVTVNVVRMLAMAVRRLQPNGWLMKQNVHVKRMPHGTCQTPFHQAVTVGLTADTQDLYLNTVSSTPTDFDLKLLDCPLVNVCYFFRAPAGIEILNAAQGVIGLDSTATAQGVGVQLRHRAGQFNNAPVDFNQPEDGPGSSREYCRDTSQAPDSGHGGKDITIPLRAAVYRTGTIIPGSIRASLLVVIQHK